MWCAWGPQRRPSWHIDFDSVSAYCQPIKETDEYDFVEHMKAQYNFKWRGWNEQGKWHAARSCRA